MITFKNKDLDFLIIIPEKIIGNLDIPELVGTLNFASYDETNITKNILEIENFDYQGKTSNVPTSVGVFKNCIYIKESNRTTGGEKIYQRGLKSIFPKYELIRITRDYSSIGISIYNNQLATLSIFKKEENPKCKVWRDLNNLIKIPIDKDKEFNCTNKEFETIISKLLFTKIGHDKLENIFLTKYVLVDIEEILYNHKYELIFNKHFPNLSKYPIYPALVKGVERKQLSEEDKVKYFPNHKELQEIIGRTISDITKDKFRIQRSGILIWKEKNHITRIYLGGSRGDIEMAISLQFTELEKYLKRITKHSGLNDYNTSLKYYISFSRYFRGCINYNSYNTIANKLFWRINLIELEILPLFQLLKDFKSFNELINYKQDSRFFTGKSSWKPNRTTLNLTKPLVSILAKDENWEGILEKEALIYIDSAEKKDEIKQQYLKIKNSFK
jgi:hypothetical protein